MLKTALDVNYYTGEMLKTALDVNYSTGGMQEKAFDVNYSTGGMLKTALDVNYSTLLIELIVCVFQTYPEIFPKPKKSNWNLDDEFSLQSSFYLRPDKIIVAADKNIGFVCMDVDDQLTQH